MTTQHKTSAGAENKNPLSFVSETDTAAGFESISNATMSIPFLKLTQALSPEINKKKSEYIENCQPGQYFNSVNRELYGDAVDVIVLSFERIYIEWLPNRGGFIGYHNPENAARLNVSEEFGKWKTAAGNELHEQYCYYVLIVGKEAEGVCILSLGSTNIGTAKAWNRRLISHVMSNGKKALPYYLKWHLTADEASNDKGTWYKVKADLAGYIDEKQYALIVPERAALPSYNVDFAQIADKTDTKQIENTEWDSAGETDIFKR